MTSPGRREPSRGLADGTFPRGPNVSHRGSRLGSGLCPQASHFTLGHRGHRSGLMTHSGSPSQPLGVEPCSLWPLSPRRWGPGHDVQDACGGERPSQPGWVCHGHGCQNRFQNSVWKVRGAPRGAQGCSRGLRALPMGCTLTPESGRYGATRPQGAPCHPIASSRQGEVIQKARCWRGGAGEVSGFPPRLHTGHLPMLETVSSFLNLIVSHLPGAPGRETPSAVQPELICV